MTRESLLFLSHHITKPTAHKIGQAAGLRQSAKRVRRV
jgi:hypothetical protein